MGKSVYSFGAGRNDGDAGMKNLLGGKGANLAEMAGLGLPVPPGFTITTEICTYYYKNGKTYPDTLRDQVSRALGLVEKAVGARFGDTRNPLLVSVRSGARASMPGMMDTVLNLGLNDATVEALAAQSGQPRFAWDSYRRFIQMYGDVVLGVPHHEFEDLLDQAKRDENVRQDTALNEAALAALVQAYKKLVRERTGRDFPADPQEQLWGAIGAVFESWMTPRAVTYRQIHDIPADWGTAVSVQAMVFGNRGDDCATGVAFTRDPSTGENYFYGEYLVNAQGEDVVAGIRTPQALTVRGRQKDGGALLAMEETMPAVFRQLCAVRDKLEKHYRDMQDIEFTVQNGKLYMLQTRAGKRSAAAALRIAVDMVKEKLITREEAVARIDPASLDQLLHPTLDPQAHKHILARGLPASPGAVSGMVVFSADDAETRFRKDGAAIILCRRETSPEDIHGMHVARGILTTRGGMTSHAAVVARGMGRPCVAGAGLLHIDYEKKEMLAGGSVVREGDIITVDGGTGEVMQGAVPTIEPRLSDDFSTIMQWADECRALGVRANAETPVDALTARRFGAEGIGLCRTEHMFFDPARIQHVREMIFAADETARRAALEKLLPAQRGDFRELFAIMEGLPVTIRLLDPPLHEFLPQDDDDIAAFAAAARLDPVLVRRRLLELHEANPMLGHRGSRLGITFPEIYEMQARAVFEAALEAGGRVMPEIMLPLIFSRQELVFLKKIIDDTAARVFAEQNKTLAYLTGTMIELPRAALMAGDIACEAAFFSFGTNDLTQTALGVSRDDAGRFLPDYIARGILTRDPFVTLDQDGVGQLITMAVERGRAARPGLKTGICGEHGGDPASIAFCDLAGLDYVSCSPYRVPIARLAAAQAALKNPQRLRARRKKAA